MTIEAARDSFECPQCEELGEISFSTLQRQHVNIPVKVFVKNLPEGISESGLKNLFLTIGKPERVFFDNSNRTAVVYLSSIKEAELAVRDLHGTPPYNLKVTIVTQRCRTGAEKKEQSNKDWFISVPKESAESTEEDCNNETSERFNYIKKFAPNLNYDPSLRMRQKLLDFKTGSDCVSMGRGFLFMGMSDRFIGGLGKFESASTNSLAKNQMNFYCENCKALTTKNCWNCSVPFCSKMCFYKSSIHHQKHCISDRDGSVKSSLESDFLNMSLDASNDRTILSEHLKISLEIGSTVIITTYLSMNTVFLRPSDKLWEEKFIRLCNKVGIEALKDGSLEKAPKTGDLVIGKYYEDLCFYRAQVCEQENEKIKLFFVDFGNSQETKLEDIKFLPDYLKSVPYFAVKVQLKDVSEGSSPNSVLYFNNLTAKRVPLILESEQNGEVVLVEKDMGEVVNKTVEKFISPSWKTDETVYSKLGEIFYLNSIKQKMFEIGETYNLIIAHFSEKEFMESGVFWVTDPETDEFLHVHSEMNFKIREYCNFLKGDYYLPRVNELCLAKEKGEWRRCVNLKSHRTTCYLFFIDDGHSSLIETKNIRKMIQDFTETSSQVICCTLSSDPKLRLAKEIQLKVIEYLKKSVGQIITSVTVLKLMGDAYCLSIPEVDKILAESQAST